MASAQDYIRNGDFEEYSSCPTGWSLIQNANYWSRPVAQYGTPDFFHTCSRSTVRLPSNDVFYQYPKSGDGLAGFITYSTSYEYREFMVSSLQLPLDSGVKYTVRFSVCLADSIGYATEFHVAFTDTTPVGNTVFPYQALDIDPAWASPVIKNTANWSEYSFEYTATGKETHIVIGNLSHDFETKAEKSANHDKVVQYKKYGYILIDDIAMFNCDSVKQDPLGKDKQICEGESVNVYPGSMVGFSWNWTDGSEKTWKSISSDSTVIIEYSDPCGVFYDTLVVSIKDSLDRGIPMDTTLCRGDSLVIVLDRDLVNVWSDGSVEDRRVFKSISDISVEQSNGCYTRHDSLHLDIQDPPKLDLGSDVMICEGDSLRLDPITDGKFYWVDGDSSTPRYWSDSGRVVAFAANECFEVSDTLYLTFRPLPIAQLPGDTVLCIGDELTLYGPLDDDILWNGSINADIYVVDHAQHVVMQASNPCGTDLDSMEILTRVCHCDALIPNAFSPNKDGHNDGYKAVVDCDMEQYDMSIYNRWGQCVFQTDDPSVYWNGTYKGEASMTGVYLVVVQYIDSFGQAYSYSESLHLIR